nr:unnamed protein product [Digitaria exilis]
MAGGRSPGLSGRRRGRNRALSTPSPPPSDLELNPLPPGTEIEVRIDDEGFYGSWYEATVVGFDPAAGRRCPAQYTVAYSHLVAVDGPHTFAPSHVRPRPPPIPAPPPPFRLHDIVEAFECNGWWSGLVVEPEPAAEPGSPVTVAFPITREVIPFPPSVIRPRRDFVVGGEWVPSRAVVDVQPHKRGVRVYKAGERVELLEERKMYGDSWFPATVAKAIDRLSYIVEYNDLDGEQGGGKATVYRHWGYIRPAEYHRPRQSKVRLFPGAAVEVHCDGAWSLGVVRRIVREGYQYEVSVDGEETELLLTKGGIPSEATRQANLRQQSASEKRPRSPVDATSSDDDHSSHLKSSTAKRSRKEPQRQELPSGNSAPPPDESAPNVIGQTEFSRNALSEMVPSHGQLNALICERNVDEASDMLSISEARKQNISSSLRNQQTQERPFPVKVPIQLKENRNSSGKEIIYASGTSPECDNSSPCTPEVSRGTSSGSDSEGVNFEKLTADEGAGLLDKELAAMINMICPTNRDENVCTDTAVTQVTKSNPPTEIPVGTLDDLVQQDESEVPFVKSSELWLHIDAMDVYKKVPQQPHFRPLGKCLPTVREGMALGLMVTFAKSVEEVSRLSITDSIASFKEKITTLHHLEENGFDVQFLRSTLVKMLQIKSDHINYLTEKYQLKSQLLEKTTSLSQIDEQLDKKEETIGKLEEELEHARQEAQKIVEEKEREDKELSRLVAADSSVKEACASAELQFQSVLAELQRKSLA